MTPKHILRKEVIEVSRFLHCLFCPWMCLLFKGNRGGRSYPQFKELRMHMILEHPEEWKKFRKSIRQGSTTIPR